ncbi:hypothetical protein ABLN85_15460, partial [Mycobacterium tuberculosis]
LLLRSDRGGRLLADLVQLGNCFPHLSLKRFRVFVRRFNREIEDRPLVAGGREDDYPIAGLHPQ